MTDEEKAEKYVSPEIWGDTYYINSCGDWSNEEMKKAYLDGLAEGRKEGYKLGCNEKFENTCMKAEEFDKYLELVKKNAELKAQIEKMKCCGNCKYLTRKLLNCENIQICKVNPNNIYGVCDIWELAE